jgi:hypothetical protein
MQPMGALGRPARMRLRLFVAVTLTVGLLAAPAATVRACSCAMIGGTLDAAVQAAAQAQVAFVGTVVDADEVGVGPFGGSAPMVQYAFQVERATVPVPDLIAVHAVDDGGGASCGFTFGLDETWFVATHELDGDLHTGLCSGNTQVGTLTDGERDELSEVLAAVPFPAAEQRASWSDWLPIAGIVLAVFAVGGITVLAFRRDRVR